MIRKTNNIYIIGAGSAGIELFREMVKQGEYKNVLAFLDDDIEKIGTHIENIPIIGPISDIIKVLQPTINDIAIIAMPSLPKDIIKSIYLQLKRQKFSIIKILPEVGQIIEGNALLDQTRDMELSDIIFRPPIQVNLKKILNYLSGQKALITGAGGSIGKELSRRLLHGNILSELYIFGHGENSIYEIEFELRDLQKKGIGKNTNIIPVLGEIYDPDFSDYLISSIKPDIIFHAAAYKHVPLMEHNPIMAIKNNLFSTLYLLKAVKKHSNARFIFISTDKVVQPKSVYGISKLLAEELVLSEGVKKSSKNKIMVVRFGNVFGSRGSIIPLFKKQILHGGPITLTDPRMKRYFMTIPEACSLVLKAGGVGNSGELYVLELGEPLYIKDLAEQMISFYGFEIDKHIEIQTIGIREGEKIEEYLLKPNEKKAPTDYDGIWSVERIGDQVSIQEIIEKLHPLCYLNHKQNKSYFNKEELFDILSTYFDSFHN